GRQLARLAPSELFAVCGIELLQALQPRLALGGAAGADRPPGSEHRIRDLEGTVWPAELLARAGELLGAERRAVAGGAALLGRRAKADAGATGDQRRPLVGTRSLDRPADRRRVMTADALDVPVVGLEALQRVVGERQRSRAVDRDLVVVVEG